MILIQMFYWVNDRLIFIGPKLPSGPVLALTFCGCLFQFDWKKVYRNCVTSHDKKRFLRHALVEFLTK